MSSAAGWIWLDNWMAGLAKRYFVSCASRFFTQWTETTDVTLDSSADCLFDVRSPMCHWAYTIAFLQRCDLAGLALRVLEPDRVTRIGLTQFDRIVKPNTHSTEARNSSRHDQASG